MPLPYENTHNWEKNGLRQSVPWCKVVCAANKQMPASQCDPWPCFHLLSSSCVRISAHRDMLIWRQSAKPMQLSRGSFNFSGRDIKLCHPTVNPSAQSAALPPVYPASHSEINPAHVHYSCRVWSRKQTLVHTFEIPETLPRNIREKQDFPNTLLVLEFWIVLAFFGQKGRNGVKAANKVLHN